MLLNLAIGPIRRLWDGPPAYVLGYGVVVRLVERRGAVDHAAGVPGPVRRGHGRVAAGVRGRCVADRPRRGLRRQQDQPDPRGVGRRLRLVFGPWGRASASHSPWSDWSPWSWSAGSSATPWARP